MYVVEQNMYVHKFLQNDVLDIFPKIFFWIFWILLSSLLIS
jgi:hypothetical protein